MPPLRVSSRSQLLSSAFPIFSSGLLLLSPFFSFGTLPFLLRSILSWACCLFEGECSYQSWVLLSYQVAFFQISILIPLFQAFFCLFYHHLAFLLCLVFLFYHLPLAFCLRLLFYAIFLEDLMEIFVLQNSIFRLCLIFFLLLFVLVFPQYQNHSLQFLPYLVLVFYANHRLLSALDPSFPPLCSFPQQPKVNLPHRPNFP